MSVAANGFHRLFALACQLSVLVWSRCNLHLRNGLVKSHGRYRRNFMPPSGSVLTMAVLLQVLIFVVITRQYQAKIRKYLSAMALNVLARCFANILFGSKHTLACKLPIFCRNLLDFCFCLDNTKSTGSSPTFCCKDVMVAHSDSKHLAIGAFQCELYPLPVLPSCQTKTIAFKSDINPCCQLYSCMLFATLQVSLAFYCLFLYLCSGLTSVGSMLKCCLH